MGSIHKSYLISLASYLGINITFGLIYIALTGGFTGLDPLSILGLLVLSAFYLPSYLITGIMGSGGNIGIILLAVGVISASVVAAVLSGYFGESKGAAFGGWALTAITAYIIVIILGFVASEVVGEFFSDTLRIFYSISGLFEEEGPSVLELHVILDLIGISPGPDSLI